MVLGLRPLLGAFTILWLSFHQCRALDNNMLSWARGFRSRNETLGPSQLMECETLNISLSPETNDHSREDVSYHILALEPGGSATVSFAGYEPSALHWTVRYPAGSQIFVALLDSFGTSLGILPAMHTVTPGSTDCLTESEPPRILETTHPKIPSTIFGPIRVIPCGSWEMSFSGGKASYSASVNLYILSVRADILQCPIVLVTDTNDMLHTAGSIINLASAPDTLLADSSDELSKCRSVQPKELPFRPHELPRPTAFRFRRTLPDYPHMHWSRESGTIGATNISYTDLVAVAVCASLGGTGIVGMAIYIIMYRRRRKLENAQDTLPRPFEVTVPAATTSTSMMTQRLTSHPTLSMPRRIYSQNRGRSRYNARTEAFSARANLSRAGSAPTLITTAPSRSKPGPSSNTRMPHSDTSSLSNPAGPSSLGTPPRSLTHPRTLTSPDPQPQSSSRVHPRQSSSLPTDAQNRRTAGVSASRAASMQARRSAKHALWLSRSASELYGAMSSQRDRVPEHASHASHASSGTHAYRHHGSELHADTLPRHTNHLRQWHSASPVVHVGPEEEDLGTTVIFQHRDAGVMQELPPPYHKLVRPGAGV